METEGHVLASSAHHSHEDGREGKVATVVLVYYDSFGLKCHRNWVHDTEMEGMESAPEHEQVRKRLRAQNRLGGLHSLSRPCF